MSLEQFIKNRNAFPTEELERFSGQHVAWSSDGTRVLASDPDPLKVLAAVRCRAMTPPRRRSKTYPPMMFFRAEALLFQGGRETSG